MCIHSVSRYLTYTYIVENNEITRLWCGKTKRYRYFNKCNQEWVQYRNTFSLLSHRSEENSGINKLISSNSTDIQSLTQNLNKLIESQRSPPNPSSYQSHIQSSNYSSPTQCVQNSNSRGFIKHNTSTQWCPANPANYRRVPHTGNEANIEYDGWGHNNSGSIPRSGSNTNTIQRSDDNATADIIAVPIIAKPIIPNNIIANPIIPNLSIPNPIIANPIIPNPSTAVPESKSPKIDQILSANTQDDTQNCNNSDNSEAHNENESEDTNIWTLARIQEFFGTAVENHRITKSVARMETQISNQSTQIAESLNSNKKAMHKIDDIDVKLTVMMTGFEKEKAARAAMNRQYLEDQRNRAEMHKEFRSFMTQIQESRQPPFKRRKVTQTDGSVTSQNMHNNNFKDDETDMGITDPDNDQDDRAMGPTDPDYEEDEDEDDTHTRPNSPDTEPPKKKRKRRSKDKKKRKKKLKVLSRHIEDTKDRVITLRKKEKKKYIHGLSVKIKCIFFETEDWGELDWETYHQFFSLYGEMALNAHTLARFVHDYPETLKKEIKIFLPADIMETRANWCDFLIEKTTPVELKYIILNHSRIQWHGYEQIADYLYQHFKKNKNKSKKMSYPRQSYGMIPKQIIAKLTELFNEKNPNVRIKAIVAQNTTLVTDDTTLTTSKRRRSKRTNSHNKNSKKSMYVDNQYDDATFEALVNSVEPDFTESATQSIDPISFSNQSAEEVITERPTQSTETEDSNRVVINEKYSAFPRLYQQWYQSNTKEWKWNSKLSIIVDLKDFEIGLLETKDYIELFTNFQLKHILSWKAFSDYEEIYAKLRERSCDVDRVTQYPMTLWLSHWIQFHPWLLNYSKLNTMYINTFQSEMICNYNDWGDSSSRAIFKEDPIGKSLHGTLNFIRTELKHNDRRALILPTCISKQHTTDRNDWMYVYYCIHFIKNHELSADQTHMKESRTTAQFGLVNIYPIVVDNVDLAERNLICECEDYATLQRMNRNVAKFVVMLLDYKIPPNFVKVAEFKEFILNLRTRHDPLEIVYVWKRDTGFALPQILDRFEDFVTDIKNREMNQPVTESMDWTITHIPVLNIESINLFRVQILHSLQVRLNIVNLVSELDRMKFSLKLDKKKFKTIIYCDMCQQKVGKAKNQRCQCQFDFGEQSCPVCYCLKCAQTLHAIIKYDMYFEAGNNFTLKCYQHLSYRHKILFYECFCRWSIIGMKLHESWLKVHSTIDHFHSIKSILRIAKENHNTKQETDLRTVYYEFEEGKQSRLTGQTPGIGSETSESIAKDAKSKLKPIQPTQNSNKEQSQSTQSAKTDQSQPTQSAKTNRTQLTLPDLTQNSNVNKAKKSNQSPTKQSNPTQSSNVNTSKKSPQSPTKQSNPTQSSNLNKANK